MQAATLRDELIRRSGDEEAFSTSEALRRNLLDLSGRKTEYLHAVADAADQISLHG